MGNACFYKTVTNWIKCRHIKYLSPLKIGYRERWRYTLPPSITFSHSAGALIINNNSTSGRGWVVFVMSRDYIDTNDVLLQVDVQVNDFYSGDGLALEHFIFDGIYKYNSLVDFPDTYTLMNPKGTTIYAGHNLASDFRVNTTIGLHIKTDDIYKNGSKLSSGNFEKWDGTDVTWADFTATNVTFGFGLYAGQAVPRTLTFTNIKLINLTTSEVLYTLDTSKITPVITGTTYDSGYFDVTPPTGMGIDWIRGRAFKYQDANTLWKRVNL
jgi:hypothetical protein